MLERKRLRKTIASVGAPGGNAAFPLQCARLRPRKTKPASNVLMGAGQSRNDWCERGHMDVTGLLQQVDPLIQAIANSYRDAISSHDYDDLVQEGRLVVLEALGRYLRKNVEINPASLSSWAYIAVSSRFKELASNGYGIVSCAALDEDNRGDNGDGGVSDELLKGSLRHVQHVCRLTQDNVVRPLLQDVLTPRDVAVCIKRTTQRVAQLKKKFIKDWEQGLEKNGEKQWKKRG